MTIVHYYLGRPAHVWIAANSRRSPARQAHKGSGRVHSGIPGQPRERIHSFCVRCGARLNRCPLAPRRQPEVLLTATSGLPPPPPAACWPAPDRDRPLGTDGPPQAASAPPWPPDWTRPIIRSCPEVYPRPGNAPRSTWGYVSVPGAIPGAGRRMRLLMATVPAPSDPAGRTLIAARDTDTGRPSSHRRPLTDPRLRRLLGLAPHLRLRNNWQ